MTHEQIEQIEALYRKATPRPWKYGGRNDDVTPASLYYERHEGHCQAVMMSPRYGLAQFKKDSAFAAALVNAWPEIYAALSAKSQAGQSATMRLPGYMIEEARLRLTGMPPSTINSLCDMALSALTQSPETTPNAPIHEQLVAISKGWPEELKRDAERYRAIFSEWNLFFLGKWQGAQCALEGEGPWTEFYEKEQADAAIDAAIGSANGNG